MTWPVVPLAEVADTALGKMLDKGKPKGLPLVPYLRNSNVQWGRIDTDDVLSMELADADRERFGLLAGDLLICEGGEPGRCAVWNGSATYMAFQKALHRVRPRETLDTKFLRYLMEHHASTGVLARFFTGSTIAHLSQQKLRRVPVPLPPVDQQQQTVQILEDHLSRLGVGDEALQMATSSIAGLQRASLDRLFGQNLNTTLGDLVSDISAGKSFGSANAPAREDEWGIIKVSAMTWGAFDASQNKAVSAERVDPRYEICTGDLLVSRANTSGYVGASVLVGQVRPRLILSDKSLRVTPKPDVSSEWLWRALQAPSARRQISSLATGTKDSMRNISQASLRAVRLPSVSLDAQEAALRAFSEVEIETTRLAHSISVQRARATRLRQALLAAAFEGKLTGRHTDTEVIEEMVSA